ncbi:MAG TPA: DoxX family protein [Tepidisphaeraceae bacterium]|jgi:putative oxidoreductase|nr:DoxX family protein [Tepidisphaeraceae bacterium]
MNEKSCDTRCPIGTSLGLLVLRLVAGLSLATHGWAKFHDPNFKSMFFDMVGKMNLPAPHALAWAAIVTELVGGVLLALGFLTRLWAFLILGVMGVAIYKVHWGQGYQAMEMAALYAGIAAAFLLGGAGRISVDGMLFCRGKKEEAPPEESVEKF